MVPSRQDQEADQPPRLPALAAFDLGSFAVPVLVALVAVNALCERRLPEVAATLTSILVAAILGAVTWGIVCGRRRLAAGHRAGVAAWCLFGAMAVATAMGLSRVYSDEPARRVVLLCLSFWIAHDSLARDESRHRFAGAAASLGSVIALLAALEQVRRPASDGRWLSLLDSASLLGCFLTLTMPLTAQFLLKGYRLSTRLGAAGGLFCQALALFGSGSRLAIASVAAVGLCACIGAASMRWRGWRRAAALTAAGAAVMALAVVAVIPRPGHESSLVHRAFIWQTSLRVVAWRPFTGVGVGSFRTGYRMCRPWVGTDRSDVLAIVRDAHNDLLHMSAECGAVAGLLFAGLIVAGIRACRSRAAKAALGAWALNGLANGSVDVAATGILAFSVIGMAVGELRGAAPAPAATQRVRVAPWIVATAVVTVFLGSQGAARLSALLVAKADHVGGAAARTSLELAAALHPSLDALLRLSQALPDNAAAVRLLTQAANLYPWEPEIRFRLGMALAAENRTQGLQQIALAVAWDPYNPYYRARRAELLLAAGENTSDAVADLHLARELFQRTREVATARFGALSPQAEALRLEIAAVEDDLRAAGGTH